MRVTQGDVARRAGVSLPVVSYVINNGPRPVAPETRQRVLDAIEELGYRANQLARSLRSQHSNTIGVIIPDTSYNYYSEVAKGIEDTAYDEGFSVILGNTNGSLTRQTRYVENLVSRQADGIIFISTTVEVPDLDILERFQIPFVYVDPEGNLSQEIYQRIQYLAVDCARGGADVAAHLVARGHRRIACITGTSNGWEWHRKEGFVSALQSLGISAQVISAGEQSQDGYRAARQLLNQGEPPTAIFACNDLLALGVIRGAHDHGLRVPQDLAVCGFDDIALASFITPRLTTVRIPKYELGRQASEMILERLAGGADVPQPDSLASRNFDTELILREST